MSPRHTLKPPVVTAHALQVFVTVMVSVQYQVKRVLLYEDGPPPAAVSNTTLTADMRLLGSALMA